MISLWLKPPTSCVNRLSSQAAQAINDSGDRAAASNYQKAVVRIITIEREYGCGEAGIARELAARLGWKLWDQLLTQEIARIPKAFDRATVNFSSEI